MSEDQRAFGPLYATYLCLQGLLKPHLVYTTSIVLLAMPKFVVKAQTTPNSWLLPPCKISIPATMITLFRSSLGTEKSGYGKKLTGIQKWVMSYI